MTAVVTTRSACKLHAMNETTSTAIRTRFKQEMARLDIPSESEAARRIGQTQQWLHARLRGETAWKVEELEEACQMLGMNFVFVATGVSALTPANGVAAPTEDLLEELQRRYEQLREDRFRRRRQRQLTTQPGSPPI